MMMTFSLHLDLHPVHPTPTAPNSFSLFNVHKQVVRVPPPTHSELSITSLGLRLSFRLKDESTIRPILRNCASLRNYVFSRLRPERQTTSSLLPSMIQYSIPAEQPSS